MARERDRKRIKEAGFAGEEKKADCPCPKTDCARHGYCAPCRVRHEKSTPYCERSRKK